MIFKDLPEFVNEETAYKLMSFFNRVDDVQKQLEDTFGDCKSAELLDSANIIRFRNDNILMFSYREDGVKLIVTYNLYGHVVIIIYDKAIYDFIFKQGSEKDIEDYTVPKLDKARFESVGEEISKPYISSFMHEYCTDFVFI